MFWIHLIYKLTTIIIFVISSQGFLKRKSSCQETIIDEKYSKIVVEEQGSLLSDFLNEDTGLFWVNKDIGQTVNSSKPVNEDISIKETKTTTATTKHEKEAIKISDGPDDSSESILNELKDFCRQKQIRKQAGEFYKIILSRLSAFKREKIMFYKLNLEKIKPTSNFFYSLGFSSRTLSDEKFTLIDKKLLETMKIFFITMKTLIKKAGSFDSLVTENFSSIDEALWIVISEIQDQSDIYEKNGQVKGEFMEGFSIELIKLHEWYCVIPELLLLHSKICSTSENVFTLIFLRAFNVFLEDKKKLDSTEVQIIHCLLLKIKSPSVKPRCSDLDIKEKFIIYLIKNNKFNKCYESHFPIIHLFISNIFPNIRNNIRQKFRRDNETYNLTYDQLSHILVSLSINLYEQLLIFEFNWYEDYKFEEYEKLLDELRKEISCYGCLFNRFYNLFTLRTFNEQQKDL